MDKREFKEFIRYYKQFITASMTQCIPVDIETIDRVYSRFGREIILGLPTEHRSSSITGPYIAIEGTNWRHSTKTASYHYYSTPIYYILGGYVTLDEWLPRSSLTPEEQILFKLKYG